MSDRGWTLTCRRTKSSAAYWSGLRRLPAREWGLVAGASGPVTAQGAETAVDACAAEIAALRREGLTHSLPGDAAERLRCLECATTFLIDSSTEPRSRPIRLGDSSRKHPTELARGRLENPPSKPEIQRATAILQVARMTPPDSRVAVTSANLPREVPGSAGMPIKVLTFTAVARRGSTGASGSGRGDVRHRCRRAAGRTSCERAQAQKAQKRKQGVEDRERCECREGSSCVGYPRMVASRHAPVRKDAEGAAGTTRDLEQNRPSHAPAASEQFGES
jgi:hypothetical protein